MLGGAGVSRGTLDPQDCYLDLDGPRGHGATYPLQDHFMNGVQDWPTKKPVKPTDYSTAHPVGHASKHARGTEILYCLSRSPWP